jgi:hypothetical protein
MPRYKVIWEDFEDCRTGEPFYVEALSLQEAHSVARDYIWQMSRKHIGAVDALVDEDATMHYPDIYLQDSPLGQRHIL